MDESPFYNMMMGDELKTDFGDDSRAKKEICDI